MLQAVQKPRKCLHKSFHRIFDDIASGPPHLPWHVVDPPTQNEETWPPQSPFFFSEVFMQFHKSVHHLSFHGSLIVTKILHTPAEHNTKERARKCKKKDERKQQLGER